MASREEQHAQIDAQIKALKRQKKLIDNPELPLGESEDEHKDDDHADRKSAKSDR